jgi:citrate/tricarballylate utilization protein
VSSPELKLLKLVEEGERALSICNACRYCEGFCAVFPAMEKGRTFPPEQLGYLANLCHDCRECYYSCQYAPPHEFDLNLPKTLAGLRRESYRRHAWPGFLVRILGSAGPALMVSFFLSPVLFLLGALAFQDPSIVFAAHSVEEGAFYRIIPHSAMVAGFGVVGAFVILALGMGFLNFWRETNTGRFSWSDLAAIWGALGDSASLRYLGGGSAGQDGCAYPEEQASNRRRVFHHLTFYGFMLCFASTTIAALYHNVLGWEAPYDFLSLPVVLGSLGGLGLLVGPAGLLGLKSIRDPEPADPLQTRMDVAFLIHLFLTSLTGLLLLLLRETPAMGVTLALHLGVVMGLFLTMPYGKFVHGIYRFGALIRFAKEAKQ